MRTHHPFHLAAVCAALFVSNQCMAADLTGRYVGIDAGSASQVHAASCVPGTWNCADTTLTNPMQRATGTTVGLHGGYNWRLPSGYLLGVEGGVMDVNANGLAIFPTTGQYKSSETKYGALKMARVRIGQEFSHGLIYLSAGVAWANLSTSFINRWANGDIINDPNGYLNVKKTVRGLVLGVGAERAISDKVSINIEYARVKFHPYQFDISTQINGGVAQGWAFERIDPSLNLIKLGINYRF